MKSNDINSEKKNSLWLALRYMIMLLSSLLIYKINIDQYGSNTIGAWFLILSVWTFGNAIDLGLGTAIVKYTAEYFNNKKLEIKYFLTSSFYAFVFLGLFLTLIIYLIGNLFVFNNTGILSQIDIAVFYRVFILLGLSFVLKYLAVFFRSVFEGMNEFIIASKIEIVSSVILLILISSNALLKLSIEYLALSYLLNSFIVLLFYIYVFRSQFKLDAFNLKSFRYSSLKAIFSYSIHIQVVNFLGGLIDPIIKFLFGGFLGLDSVTYYEVGKRFAGSVTGVFLTAFRTILPKASILTDISEQRLFLQVETTKYIRFGVFYSITVFGVLSIIIVLFINIFYGHINYVYVYLLLSLTESLTIWGSTLYIFMMGIGKGKLLTSLQIMNVILISSFLLVCLVLFRDLVGLIGYSLTVLIGNLVLLVYIKKKYSIQIKEFLINVNAAKFLVFIFVMLLLIVIIFYSNFNIYFLLLAFSIFSFFLTLREMKGFITKNHKYLTVRIVKQFFA